MYTKGINSDASINRNINQDEIIQAPVMLLESVGDREVKRARRV
jgi:hypothetical protein